MEAVREHRRGQPTKLWHFLARAVVAWMFTSGVVLAMISFGPVGIRP